MKRRRNMRNFLLLLASSFIINWQPMFHNQLITIFLHISHKTWSLTIPLNALVTSYWCLIRCKSIMHDERQSPDCFGTRRYSFENISFPSNPLWQHSLFSLHLKFTTDNITLWVIIIASWFLRSHAKMFPMKAMQKTQCQWCVYHMLLYLCLELRVTGRKAAHLATCKVCRFSLCEVIVQILLNVQIRSTAQFDFYLRM